MHLCFFFKALVLGLSVEVLRRVYLRAREMTMAGSRVVTLGKQLEEATRKSRKEQKRTESTDQINEPPP